MGRDRVAQGKLNTAFISIHAPRMGRDAKILRQNGVDLGISIHAPRMGRDSYRLS